MVGWVDGWMDEWMDDKRQSGVDNLPVRSVFGVSGLFADWAEEQRTWGLIGSCSSSSSSTLVPWPIQRH